MKNWIYFALVLWPLVMSLQACNTQKSIDDTQWSGKLASEYGRLIPRSDITSQKTFHSHCSIANDSIAVVNYLFDSKTNAFLFLHKRKYFVQDNHVMLYCDSALNVHARDLPRLYADSAYKDKIFKGVMYDDGAAIYMDNHLLVPKDIHEYYTNQDMKWLYASLDMDMNMALYAIFTSGKIPKYVDYYFSDSPQRQIRLRLKDGVLEVVCRGRNFQTVKERYRADYDPLLQRIYVREMLSSNRMDEPTPPVPQAYSDEVITRANVFPYLEGMELPCDRTNTPFGTIAVKSMLFERDRNSPLKDIKILHKDTVLSESDVYYKNEKILTVKSDQSYKIRQYLNKSLPDSDSE